MQRRFYYQLAWPIVNHAHSIDSIDDQVQHQLLQLNAIAKHQRNIDGGFSLCPNAMPLQLGVGQNNTIAIACAHWGWCLLKERPNSANDVTRSIGLANGPSQPTSCFT